MSFTSIEQSFLSRVKLLPWLQFAFTWMAVFGLVVFLLGGGHGFGPGTAKVFTIIAVVVAFIAFIADLVHDTTKLVSLRHLLQFVGFLVAGYFAIKLSNGTAVLFFISLGVTQAGQWYDSIYP